MSLTGGFRDLYSFLTGQATDYTYGYDTKPGLTSPSPLKERILKAFTMPGVEVFFRRASDLPCTDHGDDLSTKPRLFLNSIYGCGIEIPGNVYMDIRGPLGKDHLIKIKFKDNAGHSLTYQYIDTLAASNKECITITGSVNLYVTEVNYLLNPRYAYVDLNHNKHLGPVYTEHATSNLYGTNFNSNPVSPTAASYVNGPTGVNYYNLDGYGIGTNKMLSGICNSKKSNTYGQKTFAYAKSLSASYQPALPFGLFSTSNTVPELLNMQLTPVIIYAQGQKDPNNPNLIFSHYQGNNNERTQITVFYTNGSSNTFKLQEETDYFVSYERSVTTNSYMPITYDTNGYASTSPGFKFTTYGGQSYIGYVTIPNGRYDAQDYSMQVNLDSNFTYNIIKHDWQGISTDITESNTTLDGLLKSVGQAKPLDTVIIRQQNVGCVATASDYIDRDNTTFDNNNVSTKKISNRSGGTALNTIGIGCLYDSSSKGYLVKTTFAVKCSGNTFKDLFVYDSPNPSSMQLNVNHCSIGKLYNVPMSGGNSHTFGDGSTPITVSSGQRADPALTMNLINVPKTLIQSGQQYFGKNTTSFCFYNDGTSYTARQSFYTYNEHSMMVRYETQGVITFAYNESTSGYALSVDLNNLRLSHNNTKDTYTAIVGGTHHPFIR